MIAIDTIKDLARRRRQVTQLRDELCRKVVKGDTKVDSSYRRWLRAVQEYTDAIGATPVDDQAVQELIATYTARLDKGWAMALPEDHVERSRFEQHFDILVTELEALTDLMQGEEYTRAWLIRREVYLRPQFSSGQGCPAPGAVEREKSISASGR